MVVLAKDENPADLIHQIRNCLSPLQTFLDVVDTSQNKNVQEFHKTCVENLETLKGLLEKLSKV